MAATKSRKRLLLEAKARMRMDQEAAAANAAPQEDQGPSMLDSAARGAGQMITAGFQDELVAATQPIMNRVGDFLTGSNVSDTEGTYEERRDEQRMLDQQAQEANPKSYMGGQVVGALPAAVAIGASAAGSVPALIAGEATLGGAIGLGETKDITNVGQVAGDVALGATLGGATAGLGAGAAKGVGMAARKASDMLAPMGKGLKKLGNEMAAGMLKLDKGTRKGGAGLHATKRKVELDKLGEMLQDQKHVGNFKGLEKTLKSVYKERQKVGKAIGNSYDQMVKQAPNKVVPKKTFFEDVINKTEFEQISNKEVALGEMQDLAFLEDLTDLNPKQIWETAKKLENIGRTYASSADPAMGTKRDVIKRLTQTMRDDLYASVKDPALKATLKANNKIYGALVDADDALEDQLLAGYGDKGLKARASSFIDNTLQGFRVKGSLATGSRNLGRLMQDSPDEFIKLVGKYGPAFKNAKTSADMAAIHYTLSLTNSDYADQFKDKEKK